MCAAQNSDSRLASLQNAVTFHERGKLRAVQAKFNTVGLCVYCLCNNLKIGCLMSVISYLVVTCGAIARATGLLWGNTSNKIER